MSFPKYKAYKDSGVEWLGEVPEHWTRLKLKHIAIVNMGQSPKSDDCNIDGKGIPFLQGNADFQARSPKAQQFCEAAKKTAQAGDLLFSVRAPVGALNEADQQYGIGRGLCSIKSKASVPNNFLWWYLLSSRDFLNSVSTGSTFEAVSAEQVENIDLAIPTLTKEQAQIARFLDCETARIDALIAEQQRLIELLKEKRQAVISHAVTKGLDPTAPMKDSGVEWLGEVPTHWEISKANFLFEEQCRPVRECDEIVTVFRDGQVCLRSRRRESGFTLADLEHGYQGIRKGDLVVHSMDAFAGAIGVSEDDGKSTPEYVVLKSYDQGMNCEYFAHVLRVMAQRNYIFVLCQAVRERAPRFRYSKFSLAFLPVPPNHEQDEIQRYISNVLSRIQALASEAEKQIALLQERRSALISAAVTGKIDVRGWQAPTSASSAPTLEPAHG